MTVVVSTGHFVAVFFLKKGVTVTAVETCFSGVCLLRKGCDWCSHIDWFVVACVFLKRGVTVIAG